MAQAGQASREAAAKEIAHEAERQLLGALLLDCSVFTRIRAFLTPEDFGDPLHVAIYEAIDRLASAGDQVDPLTVLDTLERSGVDAYDEREPRLYLGELAANAPAPSSALRHAQVVRERAIERRDRGAQRGARVAYEERGGRYYVGGRPVIRWIDGDLPSIVDQAEEALISAEMGIYQQDRRLVRVLRRAEPSVRNYQREPGVLGLQAISPPFLTECFARAAHWEKWDPRRREFRQINPPDRVAVTYLERVGQWKLPRLWDTLSAPTLRPDGTLLQDPGYDPAMQAFYDPCGLSFPQIAARPDKRQAEEAWSVLANAVASFPYEDEVDRSVAIAALLTAVVRRSLPSAPLIAITAPLPSSGKTLLADVIGIIGMGAKPPTMTLPRSDEEAEKTALSVLMENDLVVLIDNISRALDGDWLCSMITSETHSQRVLGRNEMMKVPTRMLWLATGNHLRVSGDMRSRTLLCRINARVENPGERVFSGELRASIRTRRPEIVAAALTLLRSYITCGPGADALGVKPWGRFEAWTDMVRAPIVWMDAPDPCLSLKAVEASDPARSEHLRLVTSWWDCFGERGMTTREALDWIGANKGNSAGDKLGELLAEVASTKDGRITTRSVGNWLEKRTGAPIGGYQLVRAGVKDHVAVWKVVREG